MFATSAIYAASAFFLPIFPTLVRADCECGYTVDDLLYTDLLESDFTRIENITLNTDWIPQEYTIPPDVARGPFGKNSSLLNVVSNPLKDEKASDTVSVRGGDAGLQMIVRGGEPSDGLIPMAEIVSAREDVLYGSFRAGMKLTGTNGTCGAFFWYFNDTQEIDMEFLSAQYNDTANPVNLVLQSPEAIKNGFDAANTGTFDQYLLPFAPDEAFHEYRFDWTPDAVSFYADGELLTTMTKSVPTSPGHITLSHWSNGDPNWSAGPPEQDAILTIAYVKSYFNSSTDTRQQDWTTRCKDIFAPKATCPVPEIEENANATRFFFTEQTNMANNQTVSTNAGVSIPRWSFQGLSTVVGLLMVTRMWEWCM